MQLWPLGHTEGSRKTLLLKQGLYYILFCTKRNGAVGEASCGELLAAASLKEPGLQRAHDAAVLWMQPACCLRDAETWNPKGSC